MISALIFAVLGATAMFGAQGLSGAKQSSNAQQMSGTICNSDCVTQVEGLATCDETCTVKTGDCVLVDNQGTVTKVANQEKCKGVMGKPVKVKGQVKETEKERERDLYIEELEEMTP